MRILRIRIPITGFSVPSWSVLTSSGHLSGWRLTARAPATPTAPPQAVVPYCIQKLFKFYDFLAGSQMLCAAYHDIVLDGWPLQRRTLPILVNMFGPYSKSWPLPWIWSTWMAPVELACTRVLVHMVGPCRAGPYHGSGPHGWPL